MKDRTFCTACDKEPCTKTARAGTCSFLPISHSVQRTTVGNGILHAQPPPHRQCLGRYCTGFYVVGWTALLPVRLVVSYGWDLLLASAMLLRLHGGSYLAPYLPSPSASPPIFHSSQSLALSRPPPLAPTRPRPLAPAATAHFASAPAHSRPLRPPLRAAPAREKGGCSHAGRGAGHRMCTAGVQLTLSGAIRATRQGRRAASLAPRLEWRTREGHLLGGQKESC